MRHTRDDGSRSRPQAIGLVPFAPDSRRHKVGRRAGHRLASGTVRRAGTFICLVVCVTTLGTSASARLARDEQVVLLGVGTAHGLGMAMDGIAGQSRAGWSYDRILSLFYPGTSGGRASGSIRVGLAEGPVQRFVMPGGGTVTDAVDGRGPSKGYPLKIRPGALFTVGVSKGRPSVTVERPDSTRPSPSPSGEAKTSITVSAPGGLVPTPAPPGESPAPPPEPDLDPLPQPTEPPSEPTPTPPPTQAPPMHSASSVRLVPEGDPAVVRVESTGNRYRGVIELDAVGGSLRVVNRVALETYIAGIAEARGAGWPLEGLKALAVAARSYAASMMTWNTRNQADGYDICPTDQCQVYLGFDGEFPGMRAAASQTAGEVRTYNGRPILAMYHGNGGGQTESYNRVAGTTTSAHPYLNSVRYPHAQPTFWRRELTYPEIANALAPHGDVPNPIKRLEIRERGDSPRVMRLRVHGSDGEHLDVKGTTFMNALDLWSTWFKIGDDKAFAALGTGDVPPSRLEGVSTLPLDPRSPGSLIVLAVAIAALATATTMRILKPRIA